MYSYRARVGLIVPSLNTIMEPEFYSIKPEGVSIHVTRVLLTGGTLESLKKMDEEAERAGMLLATAGVDIITYGCTTGSMVGGKDWDQNLITRIEKLTNIPVTTTTTALMRVFRQLEINSVSVATPYNYELNQLVKNYLETNNIKVIKIEGLNLTSQDMWLASPELTYNLACEVDTQESDAILISCTNFKSLTIIEKLENKFNKFVLSSNIVTMYEILKILDIRDNIYSYGKLLQMLSK